MPSSKDVAASFTNYLRRASKIRCPIEGCLDELPNIEDQVSAHLRYRHRDLLEHENIAVLVQGIQAGNQQSSEPALEEKRFLSPCRRLKSPSFHIRGRPRSASPLRRSRARPRIDPDFIGKPQQGRLWNPDDTTTHSSPRVCDKAYSNQKDNGGLVADDSAIAHTKQRETRPISQEQLIAEGLVTIESKCIEVDNAQRTDKDSEVNKEPWKLLIAFHRTLLHQYANIHLASLGMPTSTDLGYPTMPFPWGAMQTLERFEAFKATCKRLEEYLVGLGIEDPFESMAEMEAPIVTGHQKVRRGRGARKNVAYWKERARDPDASLFDERELLFSNEHGALKVLGYANLDTQLKMKKGIGSDLIMSSHYAKELGILDEMSSEFEDPCLQSISGHSTAVKGIIRNIQFRLKGSSVTFRRNFWVCDAIDGIVDVMIGANFIKDNFKLLFEKAKECVSTFATWFSKKKETSEQKREREELERQQKIRINDQEIKRLQRENEMHQRASDANSRSGGSAQSSEQSGGH